MDFIKTKIDAICLEDIYYTSGDFMEVETDKKEIFRGSLYGFSENLITLDISTFGCSNFKALLPNEIISAKPLSTAYLFRKGV